VVRVTNGKTVKNINDFVDGENYVACGAEKVDKAKCMNLNIE